MIKKIIINRLNRKRRYRIVILQRRGYPLAFVVQTRGLFMWRNIKVFVDDDWKYALNCAEELLILLEEKI